MHAIEIVEGSTLLSALSKEERSKLAAAMHVRKASKGTIIWMGGEATDFFGIVGAGYIKMSRPSAYGHEVALELMGPGQVFGLNGIVYGRACPLNATALTDTVYGQVPSAPIIPAIEQNATFKDVLLRRTMARLHEKVDLLARMTSGRVDERIAAVLLTLAESYGRKNGKGIVLDVPLTRQEIGELAGTTTESTIRVMSRWQKEGMITTDRQTITLIDVRVLESIFALV
jgi:CRP-like cAMP-binding protein